MPNVHDENSATIFDRWFARHSSADLVRGRGAAQAVDRAPMAIEELRHYFVDLPEAKLAACWVATIVDAAARGDMALPDLAKALIVVAIRLNGLKFPEEVLIMPPVDTRPAHMRAAKIIPHSPPRAPSLGPVISTAGLAPEIRAAAAEALASQPAPAAETNGAGWILETTGPLPPPGRKGADPALLSAISRLGPLPARIRLEGKKYSSFKVAKLITDALALGGSKDLTSFKAADGSRIIYRKAAP